MVWRGCRDVYGEHMMAGKLKMPEMSIVTATSQPPQTGASAGRPLLKTGEEV